MGDRGPHKRRRSCIPCAASCAPQKAGLGPALCPLPLVELPPCPRAKQRGGLFSSSKSAKGFVDSASNKVMSAYDNKLEFRDGKYLQTGSMGSTWNRDMNDSAKCYLLPCTTCTAASTGLQSHKGKSERLCFASPVDLSSVRARDG